MKYPRHLRETPGTDMTHERVTLWGEPGAWCKRKVDTLPGWMTRGWGAWVGTQKVTPRARSTSRKEGSRNGITLGWVATLRDPLRRITIKLEEHVLIKCFNESLSRYALIQLRFERSKEYFYTLSMRFNTF